uniref:Uncharacterized protein n=1 Tax=Siphoviridae sp. ctHNg1 TaxID=2827828 RepID=A0A8S5TFV6_9CAUD|nr:MAG TPA: hypothetical protein [Siphoviridae sp. ctHNg1]
MNCFLNELTKKTCIKSKILYTRPQAQACGFFVCNNKSSDRNHCLSAVANS